MIANPFTGQVLNANPHGYNQHTGKGPTSSQDTVVDRLVNGIKARGLPYQHKHVTALLKERNKSTSEEDRAFYNSQAIAELDRIVKGKRKKYWSVGAKPEEREVDTTPNERKGSPEVEKFLEAFSKRNRK